MDIEPLHPIPLLPSTENGPIGPAMVVGTYRVRRVPMHMLFRGEYVGSLVHPMDKEAVIADPHGAEVDVERTEAIERGFAAGALALWQELIAADIISPASLRSRLPRLSACDWGESRLMTVSGCYVVWARTPKV